MFYLIIFSMTKRGTWRHRSRDQSVLNVLVRFQSTFFVIDWQVFAVFLNNSLHCIVSEQLSISQFHLLPAPPSPGLPPGIGIFFALDDKFSGWGLLSCQIPLGGDKKRGQMPRPPSTLQHFSMIAQSNSAILSILMCAFLFQLTSSFIIALARILIK